MLVQQRQDMVVVHPAQPDCAVGSFLTVCSFYASQLLYYYFYTCFHNICGFCCAGMEALPSDW
jgi:hypothetical protein